MSTEAGQRPSRGQDDGQRSRLGDFLVSAALIFDFAGVLGWRSVSTVQNPTDADALAADWDAVGSDLRWAMGRHPSNRPTL